MRLPELAATHREITILPSRVPTSMTPPSAHATRQLRRAQKYRLSRTSGPRRRSRAAASASTSEVGRGSALQRRRAVVRRRQLPGSGPRGRARWPPAFTGRRRARTRSDVGNLVERPCTGGATMETRASELIDRPTCVSFRSLRIGGNCAKTAPASTYVVVEFAREICSRLIAYTRRRRAYSS